MGYPVIGLARNSVAGGTLGSAAASWRFHEAYGFLEYKLNNLNPDEEAMLTGAAVGAVALVGPQPAIGDTMTLTVSGGPLASAVALTVTMGTVQVGYDNRLTLANQLAGAVSQSASLQTAGFLALAPYGTGAYALNAVALAEIALTCPVPFTLAASGTGAVAPQITATGTYSVNTPYGSLDGTTTLYGYINLLNALDAAYLGSSQNLDTIEADVWKGRSNELGLRLSQYEVMVDRLSDALGVMRNPKAKARPERRGGVRYA